MNEKLRVPLRHSLRFRFLALSLGLVIVSILLAAYLGTNALFQAGEKAEASSANMLRNQAEESIVNITAATATRHNMVLENVQKDAEEVAAIAANIFESPDAFSPQDYWSAADSMFYGGEKQYINSTRDISTVFVPNTVNVDAALLEELELSAFLDMVFPNVLKANPDAVAIYYISAKDISRLYPNINLGSILPADYTATQDIFFRVGNAENNPDRKVVWTPVYDDPAGQGLLVSAIAPVYISQGGFKGVIGIDVRLERLTSIIGDPNTSIQGYSILIDAEGHSLGMPEQAYLDLLGREQGQGEVSVDLNNLGNDFDLVVQKMKALETGFSRTMVNDKEFLVAYTSLPSPGWAIASIVEADSVLGVISQLRTELRSASQDLLLNRIIPFGLVLLLIMLLLGVIAVNQLLRPVLNLAAASGKVQAGNWNITLPPSRKDEVGLLTSAFKSMLSQQRNLVGSLEQRVNQRTQELVLATEVGQSLSTVRDLDALLSTAVDLIRERFDLYYVQVYLADPTGRTLLLRAGSGTIGAELLRRGHRLSIGAGSINGRVAADRKPVVVPDTTINASFKPNPLLPETRSEISVPMLYSGRLVGVLNFQNRISNSLTVDLLPALEALAGQLAAAIENAYLYEQSRQAQAEIEAQARRLTREGWQEFLDAIQRSERIGFVYNQGVLSPLKERRLLEQGEGKLGVPIMVGSESIGGIQLERSSDSPWEESEEELVHIIADRIARQMETLRVLAQAEGYRSEAEAATRRLTREGWDEYARNIENQGFVYDLSEVRPLQYGEVRKDRPAVTQPLISRSEKIGELRILDVAQLGDEDSQLVTTVSERLSEHIENLRLSEQTMQALSETETLYSIISQLNVAQDYDAILDAVAEYTILEQANRSIVMFTFDRLFGRGQTPEWANPVAYRANDNFSIADRYPISAFEVKPNTLFTNKPVAITSIATDSRLDRITRTLFKDIFHAESAIIVPLMLGDQSIGFILGSYGERTEFPPTQVQRLSSVANQVAVAVQSQQLLRQTVVRARREQILLEISAEINRAVDTESIMRTAVTKLGQALGKKAYVIVGTEALNTIKE